MNAASIEENLKMTEALHIKPLSFFLHRIAQIEKRVFQILR